MTDVDTFSTNPFPTTALTGLGLVCRKSVSADATVRPYKLFADDRSFLLFVKTEVNAYYTAIGFGEIFSLVPGDAYRTAIFGRWAENSAVHATYDPFYGGVLASMGNSPNGGSFIARSYLGVGTGMGITHYRHHPLQGTHASSGEVAVPNAPDGSIALARRLVSENTGGVNHLRGRIRGLWLWCGTTQPYNDGDTFSGVAELASRSFEIVTPWVGASPGTAIVERSDTLETN